MDQIKDMRILVIEDDVALAKDIITLLKGWGWQTEGPLAYIEQAAEFLTNQPVDLVVIDRQLGGLQIARMVNKQFDIPAILLLIEEDLASIDLSLEKSIGTVIKPITWYELKTQIEFLVYRNQMEHKLRHSEIRWESVVTNAPNLILLIDRNFHIQFLNHRMSSGKTPLDQIDIFAHIEPAFHGIARQVIRSALDEGLSGHFETMGIYFDGSKRWFSTYVSPIYENDVITGATLISTDITEHKSIEAALAQRLEIEQLIAELSIEFTNYTDINQTITNALKRIGELRKFNRASLLNLDPKSNHFSLGIEWHSQGFHSVKKIIKTQPIEKLNWSLGSLNRSELLIIDNPTQIAKSGQGRQILSAQAGMATFAIIPLLIGEQISGLITFGAEQPRIWEQDDVTLLQLLGNLVSGAMERVRAEEAERLARQHSEALRNAMAALTAELDEEAVLESVLVQLDKIMAFDLAIVLLYQDQVPTIRAMQGAEHLCQYANNILHPEGSFVKTIQEHRQLAYIPDTWSGGQDRFPEQLSSIRCWVKAPLISHGQQLGQLVVFNKKPDAFRSSDLQLIEAFADQAAIGIENAQLYANTYRQSITDELTQIWNRRHFFELAQVEFQRSDRYILPLSAIMIDIDHFKIFNDTYGHAAGDKVLRAVAQRIRQELRSLDLLGKYGGEEFAVLLVQTGINEARLVAERLRKSINSMPLQVEDQKVSVSISLGLAVKNKFCPSLDDLLSGADQALYQAKQNGRNRVEVHLGEAK